MSSSDKCCGCRWSGVEALHAVASDVEALACGGSFRTASLRFGEFRLRCEELMRDAEACVCREHASTLKEAHRRVRFVLDTVGQALSRDDAARLHVLLGQLTSAIAAHELQEQRLAAETRHLGPADGKPEAPP